MKTISILLIAMLFAMFATGQKNKKTMDEIKVTPPQFTGVANAAKIYQQQSFTSFKEYLKANLKYPEKVLRTGAEGTEVVQFEVSADGELTDFKVINSVSPEIDAAIYEILKKTCGMWKPGETNGKPVSMEKEIAIEFKWKGFEEFNSTKDFDVLAKHYMTKGTEQLFTKNNPKKALRLFNHGIKYRPNEDCLLMARGMCRYQLDDEEGAQNDWTRMQTSGVDSKAIVLSDDFKEMPGYEELAEHIKR